MNTSDFENKMEKLTSPMVHSETTKRVLKIALVNARKSANIGLVLLAFPLLFFLGNVFKYQLGIDLGFIAVFVSWIGSLDTVPVLNWIVRFLLLGGPAVAILINLLAITHFYSDKESNEFIVTFKLKWVNIFIILFCGLLLFLFMFYLMVENIKPA